jgi:MFS superfamily sulfate permease-like transporter
VCVSKPMHPKSTSVLPPPGDLLASVVVFLVALPLCMGVAIASGVPPAAGLVTGIIGGLIVGTFSGAPLQVSGPAAGLTVLVFDVVQRHGLQGLGAIVAIAGAIQIVAGLARTGRLFQAVPPAVIAGMLAGIGVLIMASQSHVLVGQKPLGSGLQNIFAIPASLLGALASPVGLFSLGLGAAVVVMMAAWPSVVKRLPILKKVPSALVAVLIATVVAQLAGAQVAYVQIPESLAGSLRILDLEGLKAALTGSSLGDALAIALIASAETLLCAVAVDRMHTGPRTQFDRELFAQGVGNLLCGVVGAIPMTGVIVRSSANVEAGAKTRWSTIFHGAWLLLLVLFAGAVLRLIPIPALAGLLLFTGFKLAKQDVRSLARNSTLEAAIFFLTVIAIVSTDLLKGVIFGLLLALMRLVWNLTHLEARTVRSDEATDLYLAGAVTFVRLPALTSSLSQLPAGGEVRIHLGGLSYIDHAGLEAIHAWEKQHLAMGGTVTIDRAVLQHRATSPKSRSASVNAGAAPSSALPGDREITVNS